MTGSIEDESVRPNGDSAGPILLPPTRAADMRSHFQYILRNLTESSIAYVQTQTADSRLLEVGEEVSYSFSNPYQPKLLEIAIDGWSRSPPFPIDAPGTRSFTINSWTYC